MGIKNMQGVAAHIEYIKKDNVKVKFVNCKFWKNKICYNNISTKYGGICHSKRECMYSIPITSESEDKLLKIYRDTNSKVANIKKKYFSELIETNVKIEGSIYKITYIYMILVVII